MNDFNDASARAHSRAVVYQAIEDTYGSKKPERSSSSGQIPVSQNSITNNSVNVILDAINDNSYKSRLFITEMLNGKQIVIENVKTPRDLKANSKAKIKAKRKVVISNKKLKQKGLCIPTYRSCNADISLMHIMWWSYIKQVIKSCLSEAQLQARLFASDMVGARAVVLDSVNDRIKGVKGIITAVSGNCFYLVVDTIPGGKNLNDKDTVTPTANNLNRPVLGKVLRIIKDQCNVGIVIPAIDILSTSQSHVDLESSSNTNNSKTPVKSVKRSKGNLSVDVSSNNSGDDFESDNDESVENSVSDEDSLVDTKPDEQNRTAVEDFSYKVFDFNEKSENVKLCILYGKHYLPHCKFSDRQ